MVLLRRVCVLIHGRAPNANAYAVMKLFVFNGDLEILRTKPVELYPDRKFGAR